MEKEYNEALVFDIPENLEDCTIIQKRNINSNAIKSSFNIKLEIYEIDKELKIINLNENSTKEELIEFLTYLNKATEIKVINDKEAEEIRNKRLNNIFD